MESSQKKGKNSRRTFLETGIAGTAGVALGLIAANMLESDRDKAPEMVKMLTADGRLVQIEKRHLPPICGNPVAVSNETLLEWMDKGK